MRKNRKFLILLFILLMVLAVGCGTSDGNQGVNQSENENQSGDELKAEGLTNFETKDIYGEEFNQEIFKDYQLTLVNVWGTFCGPCIDEMPSLGEIQKEYQEKGVNIVGIVVDVQDSDMSVIDKQLETAKDIVTMTGADYIHLILSQELIEAKIGEVSAIPASFFVDSEGNFVGETYVGSRDKKDWIDIIEKTLRN